jgi:hypothetical protein
VVERLARRCGFEPLAAVMPASDSKLLAHIRKQVLELLSEGVCTHFAHLEGVHKSRQEALASSLVGV